MGKSNEEKFQKEKQTISKETYKGRLLMFNPTNMEIAPAETEEQKIKRLNFQRWQNLTRIHVRFDKDLITKKQLDELEDRNEHGLVAIKLAKSFGTYQEVLTVMEIMLRHIQQGSIDYEDQKVRDQIINKYYTLAK